MVRLQDINLQFNRRTYFKLLLLIFLLPMISFSQTVRYRQYKPGEISRYKLTAEVYRDDKFTGKSVSISEHKVVEGSGALVEKISWLSKISFTPGDTTNLDSIAKRVNPYNISLSPRGKVILPKLTIPEMVGDITDLNTFFVAIAPALNIHKLSSKTPTFINDKPIQGNFADGIKILYGTDCIEVTQHLSSTTKKYSVIRTDFTPPAFFCLTPLLDTIAKKTFDHPNNFQMIQKGTGDKVNLFWGVETFTITSKIDNKNGQVIEAAMTNVLTLRMRYGSSQDLKNFAIEMPIRIKRNLSLELVRE